MPAGALAYFPPNGAPGTGLTEVRNTPPGSDQDSTYVIQPVAGTLSWVFAKNSFGPDAYLYFVINPNETQYLSATTAYLTVRYYDATKGAALSADYDSTDTSAPVNGAYENTGAVTLTGTNAWKTQTWTLSNASFKGAENSGADFRLDAPAGVQVAEVILSLTKPS